ncbi:MAG TPA: CPBP family glutamic-type intramembrane protease [Chitinophagaceae bacterium]|nr:CPBP family glutamic-type intramembrane protease [Chitinophagaceae bacterium]
MFRYISSLRKHFIIYLFPPLLIIANYFAFNFFVTITNIKEGYLSGMIFYWIFFCIIPVLLWIRKPNRKLLLKIKQLNWWQVILLVVPVALAFGFGPFKNRLIDATPLIIILSLLYAVINAFCEEFLWRGLYFDHHQANFFYAVIVPSIWFGIWHYVPLSVQPAGIGNFYFILVSIGLGFCWAVVTYIPVLFSGVLFHML